VGVKPPQDFNLNMRRGAALSVGMEAEGVGFTDHRRPEGFVQVSGHPREIVDGLATLSDSDPWVFWPTDDQQIELRLTDAAPDQVELGLKNLPAGVPLPIDATDQKALGLVDPDALELATSPIDQFPWVKVVELSGWDRICWVDEGNELQVHQVIVCEELKDRRTISDPPTPRTERACHRPASPSALAAGQGFGRTKPIGQPL
jgi:hypothetical protein